MKKIVRGAKGKGASGGSSRTPIENPDTLHSRAQAKIIDLICEGEIQGLATGDLRSVYLDQTPIMNDDGSSNFSGVTVATRNGTQGQTYIPGFPDVESEHAVGVQVTTITPVVRTITDTTYSAVRVTISIPQMSTTNTKTGDVTGGSVQIAIDRKIGSDSYVTVVTDTIAGKTTTKYQRSYLISLPGGGGPWNIRVRRITDDSESQYVQNQTWWDSYTEIVEAKLRYPNSALVATIIDAQQFDAIPVRGYDMKLLRTKVPSNASVRADGSLTYSGSWDGTFIIRWHSNPAWAFYDMLTSDRYGLGAFVSETQVDKWALYTIGQYCDELVPDGFGGTEPRFSCNLYLQTRAEAFKVMQDMASIFRGMVFYNSGGLITAIQDAPTDAINIYTKANVVDGLFTYSGTSLKTRHSVALVQWNDPDNFYAITPEYVEDAAAILRYGIVDTSVVAVGCTSRGQAHRVGKWLLYSEANETETVTFSVGLDGAIARPGQVIKVQDADRAGIRLGGRVVSATTTDITVDRAFTPAVGSTYTFYAMMPDGSVSSGTVASVSGNVITLSTALTTTPQANAIWAIEGSEISMQTFRVASVIDSGDGVFEITATAYNDQKFSSVEQNVVLAPTNISLLSQPTDAPQNLSIDESLYQSATEIKTLVSVSWTPPDRAVSYVVSYRRDYGNYITYTGVQGQLFEIRDAQPGLYEVYIWAVNVSGRRSTAATAMKTVFGKTAPPRDVVGFSLTNVSNGIAQLTWQQSLDLDVQVGGSVRIRYTPELVSPEWANAVDIGPALPGNATLASVPHVNGTYLAKFVDSSGNSSVNAVGVETTTASLVGLNFIATLDESGGGFAGTRVNTIYNSILGGLVLEDSGLVDDADLVDSWPYVDSLGGIAGAGEYYFSSTVDLGAVYTSLVTATISALAYDSDDLWDSRTGLIDTWTNIDGVDIDDVNAALYVRTTNDDPAGSPTWGSWRPFFVGQYACRGYQFKLEMSSGFITHNIAITGLQVRIDMPDRVQAQQGITSGSGTYNAVFPTPFKGIPALGINAGGLNTGDYFTIGSVTATGFSVTFKNSSGVAVSRVFDYIAKGY